MGAYPGATDGWRKPADGAQNGLGVEEDLYQAVKFDETPVISSCAWIGIMTSSDGKVVTWRGIVSGSSAPYSHRLGSCSSTELVKMLATC